MILHSILICQLLFCAQVAKTSTSLQLNTQISVPRETLLDSLSQEADSNSSPEKLEIFSLHLAKMLVGDKSSEAYVEAIAHRLAKYQLMVLHGKRKAVTEDTVAAAFNELMKQVQGSSGAQLLTDADVVHRLRLAVYNTYPNLSTVQRNSSECLPTESVLLLILLEVNNGQLGPASQVEAQEPQVPKVSMQSLSNDARSLCLRYSLSHSNFENIKLYDHIASLLNF